MGQIAPVLDSVSLWKRITFLEGRYLSNFPIVFARVERLLDETMTSDCTGCKGRALMLMGEYYWANGQYPEGLKFFRQAITISRSIGDYNTWSTATDFIANTYYYQAYYDSAEYYFKDAYAIAEGANDFEGMILILHNISLMYHRKGDFERTIEYIFRGEKLKDQHPETRYHIEALGAMGPMLIDSIYYREEIRDENRNLKHFLSEGDLVSVNRTYHNLGKAYRQLEEYTIAARYFVKACQVMQTLDLVPEWDLAGIDYRQANMKDSSFYYHYLAKEDFFKATQPNASYTMEMLGSAHLKFGRPDSALYYYDSALAMSYRMNNRITFTGIHRQLVRTHTLLGNFDSAEYHLLKGIQLAKEVALIHEKNLYLEGIFLYQTKGDYKKALHYSERYTNYLDSLNKQETTVNLTHLQVEFKTAKKESELKDVTQNYLLTEEKIKTRNLQISLSLISLLLFGSFGGFYFTRFKRKQKMSEVLERKNKEKETLLHEIHHRVKNNLQIISSLINIKSRSASKETVELLNDLNNRIYSLGLIHEMLYKSDHLGAVDLKAYLTEQSQLTLASLELKRGAVELQLDIDEIEVNFDVAIALGLISNELITNAMKYAFALTQQKQTIHVALHKVSNQLYFIISDNGRSGAIPEITKSFGLRFVEQLVKSKLNGELNITFNNGLWVEMILRPKV